MERIAAETFTRMAKRLVVLLGVLAVMLAAAVPVFAQEEGPEQARVPLGEVTVTGLLVSEGQRADGTPVFGITDELSDAGYLLDGTEELASLEGQRVTISGEVGGLGGVRILAPTSVEPAQGPAPDPSLRFATATFELAVEGEPPAGTEFSGVVGTYRIEVPLTDPDGDGTYTGSTRVPKYEPGTPAQPGEEVSFPVRIERSDLLDSGLGVTTTIRDFGVVKFDEDKTFEASVSFEDGGATPPENTTPESTTPEPGNSGGSDDSDGPGSGGSNNSGDSDSGGSGSGDSGGGSDSGSSGSGDSSSGGSGSSGSGNDAESSGSPSGVTSGIRGMLPSTGGGVALWVLGAGILLIGGGLLVRKLAR